MQVYYIYQNEKKKKVILICRLVFQLMHKTDGTFSGMSDKKKQPKNIISLINIASPLSFHYTLETNKRGPCFVLGQAILHRTLQGSTQETQTTDKCILAELQCICTNRTTIAWRVLRRAEVEMLEALRLLLHSSGTLSPHHTLPLSGKSKKTRSQGQSPDTFPSNFHCRMCSFLAVMACHFTRAFGQELNLVSKQIFRGAIFHQVLIFLHSRSLYSLI